MEKGALVSWDDYIIEKAKVYDPAAVAAAVGRKKYGKERFQQMAAAGKKRKEKGKTLKHPEKPGGGERFAKLEHEIASKNKTEKSLKDTYLGSLSKATEKQEKAAKKYALSEKTKEKISYAGSPAREEMSADMFLKPNKTYPWKIDGKPSKKLLVAAYRRAITQNEPSVAMKAKRLLKEHFGKEFETPEQVKKSLNFFDLHKARTPGAKDIKQRKKRERGSGAGVTTVVKQQWLYNAPYGVIQKEEVEKEGKIGFRKSFRLSRSGKMGEEEKARTKKERQTSGDYTPRQERFMERSKERREAY